MGSDRLYETILRSLAFFWPIYVIGFPIGAFHFTVSDGLLIAVGLIILSRGRFLASTLAIISVFMSWSLIVTLPRYEPSMYLLSWIGMGVMLLPFCGVIPDSIRSKKILDALYWGTVLSFGFAAYEIGVSLVGFPSLSEIFTFGLWPHVRTHDFLGMQRVKSTMIEPAHYARYLVFVYAILETAAYRGYTIQYEWLFKAVLLLALISTLSLSGIILLLFYIGIANLARWRQELRKLLFPQFWITALFSFFLLTGSLYAAGVNPIDVVNLFVNRLGDVVEAVQLGIVVGSEGSRIQSTLVLFEYLSKQDSIYFFVGEGYSQASAWLTENYGHLPKSVSSFARGDLHNIFSLIGISMGAIGLILYCCIIANLVFRRGSEIPFPIVALWIVSHFSTGYILGYNFWLPLIIPIVVFRNLE